MKKNNVLIAIALLALAAAGVIATRYFRSSAARSSDFPDGIFWLCENPDCGAEYVTSEREMNQYFREHPDENNVACPKCGTAQTVRAKRCVSCKRHFARPDRGTREIVCPHCGQLQPKATAGMG